MKTLLLIAFILLSGNVFSQTTVSGLNLTLLDSVKLEVNDFSGHYNFPIIKADRDFIYHTGGDSLQVKVFNFKGNLINKIPNGKADLNLRHSNNSLAIKSDGSVYFGYGKRSLIHYSSSGEPLDTLSFHGIYNNKTYYLNQLEGVTNFAVKDSLFYLPVFHLAKDLAFEKNPKYYRNSNKLIAVCAIRNKNLIIKKIIADRDPVYYSALFPHLNHAEFQLIETDSNGPKLFVNEMASPTIRVYDLDEKQIHIFGESAKYPGINAELVPNPYRLNRDKGSFLSFKSFIESPAYTFVYHSAEKKLTFRGYRSSVKDPTNYKKFKIEVKACNDVTATPTDIAQHAALKSKPYGLQIYDAQNKLTYDEIMPRPARNILKVEGNTVWVDGRADKANNAYWIYKYKINQSEAPLGSAK